LRRWTTSSALLVAAALVLSLAAAGPASASNKQPAIKVLNSLPVAPERPDGYDRDLFQHWVDLDGNGCDAREDVLVGEAVSGTPSGCTVIGGSWFSEYDGVTTTNSSSFDIDHRVPLKEAWDSGAWRWDAATRRAYANDLGYAQSLIAVSASSNRSKSDRDPAEWLPDRRDTWCKYAKTWIAVKYRWRLAVDTAEKSTLTQILKGCSPMMRVPSLGVA
jgi:hypothetical protein